MASQPWLSFNQEVYSGDFGLQGDDDKEIEAALMEPLKLKEKWVLWEQVVQESSGKSDSKYADATRKVVTFDTVQEFWGIWNGLPQPSELLESKRIMRDQQNGTPVAIDAIMIFRDGIRPEWEDKMNATGGHFQIALKPTQTHNGGMIDEYWNNLVLGVVGGTIEPSEIITGVRLVDKLSGPKAQNSIRIELWYTRANDTAAVNSLRKSMDKHLGTKLDGSVTPVAVKADQKSHSGMKH